MTAKELEDKGYKLYDDCIHINMKTEEVYISEYISGESVWDAECYFSVDGNEFFLYEGLLSNLKSYTKKNIRYVFEDMDRSLSAKKKEIESLEKLINKLKNLS